MLSQNTLPMEYTEHLSSIPKIKLQELLANVKFFWNFWFLQIHLVDVVEFVKKQLDLDLNDDIREFVSK